MCIVLLSNAHPEYSLIVLSNRDEFLDRPTKAAAWWDLPNSDILGGRDVLREERGTWLSMHRDGRLGILTNFREEGNIKPEARSRGGLIKDYLTQPAHNASQPEDFLSSLREGGGLTGIGGFSLIYGKAGHPLAVISNRSTNSQDVVAILEKRETIGLSNALISDRTWTKVTEGESLLQQAIQKDVDAPASREDFLEELFRILSLDTLPRSAEGQNWESQLRELRKSIFIPPLGGEENNANAIDDDKPLNADGGETAHVYSETGPYGTQKQTVILVTHDRRVVFIERTLVDRKGQSLSEAKDAIFEFEIRDP